MRITSNSFPNTLVYQLQRLTGRLNQLQEQTATGQRIVNPSDDPAAAARIFNNQAEQAHIQQYHRNALRADDIVRATTSEVRNLLRVSERASEIVTLSDELKSDETLGTYGVEVDSLLEQALFNANGNFDKAPLFGGNGAAARPFEATRNAEGRITAVAYVGGTESSEIQIGEGGRLSPYSGYDDNQKVLSFLNNLVGLRDALNAGDSDAVRAQGTPMVGSEDALIETLSAQGALQARIEIELTQNRSRFADLSEQISREADVDLAQTVVQLTQNQNAYQAALMSAGKVLDRSLLDYL